MTDDIITLLENGHNFYFYKYLSTKIFLEIKT